ncbi:MAG: 6-bladed beta-propeller [Elusimicrobia bacterium]|nr:6-bladed beta-propeller [Elusimicrobiota bacterium]
MNLNPKSRLLAGAAFLALALPLAREAAAFDKVDFLEPWSVKEAVQPVSLAAAGDRVYVVDRQKCAVLIYDGQGRFLKSVGSKGKGPEQFRDPEGIAVGPEGRVFVADKGNARIQLLDADGKFLWSFGSSLEAPKGVSVGTDGRVYVADTDNARVKVFTKEGIFLYGFGSKGKEPAQFKDPAKVAVSASDDIFVFDEGNERVQRFDPATRFVAEIAIAGDDLALDAYGFLYVLDQGKAKVYEYDPKGVQLGKFGSSGKGKTQFNEANAIALAPGGEETVVVLVLDAGNSRIQRVSVVNRLKTRLLASNPAAKLLVTGPSAAWKVKASVLRALGDSAYAYDADAGQFIALDKAGREVRRFGTKKGKGSSVTKGTRGFAVSGKYGFFVSDTPGNRIQLFDLEGRWKTNFAEQEGFFDSKKNEGRVRSPRGVAVTEEGAFYVADTDNRRVDVFNPDGAFLSAIGPNMGDFELSEPHDVAWDAEGFLYILDKGLKKVLKCGPSGNLVASWGGEGDGVGQFRSPEALAYDGKNYVFVLDRELRRVSVFTKEGRWMTDLLSPGKAERELDEPVSIAMQDSRLLVADRGKGRIVSFDMHPYLTPPVAVSTSVKGGVATLSWKAVSDPWALEYVVLRSPSPTGPWEKVGTSEMTSFEDATVASARTYFYSLATKSGTGDIGSPSSPVAVFVSASANRAPVEISTVVIGNIFSANYKWYLKNPVGSVTVKNNVSAPFQNLKVTFRLKEFMDFGYDTEIKRLGAEETAEVPLIATLNNKILDVSEDTPVQAEFELSYFEEGQPRSVSLTKPLRVYSRNAITWDEPGRIGTFITPKDPPIVEYSREVVRTAPAAAGVDRLNSALVTAQHVWDALSESGVKFITNPSNPYEAVSEDPSFPVDYTQFPRDTLKLKSGQCDDLSTLLASLLESSRVKTALLDFPGHMALMFDTESDDPLEVGLPEGDLISHGGTLWVPVEATMVGRPFSEAVRKAAYSYRTEKAKDAVNIIETRQAWLSYEPATLPRTEWAPEVPSAAARGKRSAAELAGWARDRYRFLKSHYEGLLKKDGGDLESINAVGVLEHESGNKDDARKRFKEALALNGKDAAAWNNLGTMDFMAGDYPAAEANYLKASAADPDDPAVWLNLARCGLKLKNAEKARQYSAKAVALDPGLAPAVETWLK